MKVKGTLLKFNVKDKLDITITKDCKIDIPERIPLVNLFAFHDPYSVCGYATVERTEDGYVMTGHIDDSSPKISEMHIGHGIGCYMTNVLVDGIGNIKAFTIKACSFVKYPAHPDYIVNEILED